MSDSTDSSNSPDPAEQPAPSAYPPPSASPAQAGPPAPAPYGSAQPGAVPPPYGSAPQYGAPAYGAAPAYGYGAAAKTNTLAIVSLIASIAGLVVVPFVGSIVGVITGHMSLSQIGRTGEGGRGLGLAGTILGWVGIGFSVLGLIVLFALLPILLASVTTTYS